MKTWAWLLVGAITFVLAGQAQAQIVHDMTPERIREAIVLGTSTKRLELYRIQEKARFSWPPLIAGYSTPFLRVALAANAAKLRYQQFTEADVTPEMTAPDVFVYAPAHPVAGAVIANVVTIILLPHNGKDTSQAVHPTRTFDMPEEYKNLLGFSAQGRGLVAVFPFDVWTESDDVHVVFDTGIPSSQGVGYVGGCTDCKVRINLKDVR
ncbi:MAG: hypothetical protein WA755_13565 [Candidatus Acidiferrales bacterium]